MIPTFRSWTHTSDDSYMYQLSLVVATATVSYTYAPGTVRVYLFSRFFFKQKTAYEIMPSLVGSEMCIRDRHTYLVRVKKSRLVGGSDSAFVSTAAELKFNRNPAIHPP